MPRLRCPPRWLLNTLGALAEAAVRGWLKLTVTRAVRATARALASEVMPVVTGA